MGYDGLPHAGDLIRDEIRSLARSGVRRTNPHTKREFWDPCFTADDLSTPELWAHLTGAAFRELKGKGVIRHVGFTRSKRAGRNKSTIRVWRGMGVDSVKKLYDYS